jgi:hypothetical protein
VIESQTQQHVPFRLEAQVIALALELAWMDDKVRACFPPENREVLLNIREKWSSIASASVNGPEGSE